MNNKTTTATTNTGNGRITKTSYEEISKSISTWPQWKKNLCNQELIISVKAKKI